MKRFFAALVLMLFVGIAVGMILSVPAEITGSSWASMQSSIPGVVKRAGNDPNSFSEIAKSTTPAVVTITSEKKQTSGLDDIFQFHKDIPEQGIGSGVLVSEDGFIVTNNHVIDGAERITVRLNDRRVFQAELLGTDPLTDIAIIKIDAKKLPVIRFGNSDDLEVGDWVVAVGSPLNLNSTVTAGIVSAIGRQIDIIGDQYGVENFIQTDAVINPGNSGGALLNANGELIGINTAIATKTGLYQGYGFAVPSAIVRQVMQDVVTYGRVVRGYIGVGIKDVDPIYAKAVGLERSEGVLVETLTENGAARQGGLQEGDVILEIDGKKLKQRNELQAYVALHKPGDAVKLVIFRDRQKINKSVILRSPTGETTLPESRPGRKNFHNEEELGNGMGFEVESLRDRSKFGAAEGVIITKSSWHAKEQNIYEGLIITRINKTDIRSMDDFRSTVRDLKNGDAVVLYLADARAPENKIITAVEVRRKE